MRVIARSSVAWAALALLAPSPAAAEPRARWVRVAGGDELPGWQTAIGRMLAEGSLRVRQLRQDTMIAGRDHARLAQYHGGVPVLGGELAVQTEAGRVQSVFGTLDEGLDLELAPRLSADQALRTVERLGFAPFGSGQARS